MNKLIIACLGLTLTACGTTDSSELDTGAILANMDITTSSRSDSVATASLKDDFNDVALSPGDRLTLTTDLQGERDFVEGGLNGFELPIDIDTATATVAFVRESGTSAPSSTVAVPARLALTAPLDGATVSVADQDLAITWSNVVDGAEVDVYSAPCGGVSGSAGLLPEAPPDTGSLTLPIGELGSAGDCVTLVITRTVMGTVDGAFSEDSEIEASRQEEFDVMLAP